jgi:hypothetical protein
MSKPTIEDIGKEYRLLKSNEILREEDQYWDAYLQEWFKTNNAGNQARGFCYRRLRAKPKPKGYGNFELKVSFDMYKKGTSLSESEVCGFVDFLEENLKMAFLDWEDYYGRSFEVKNVKWGEW